MFVAVSRPSLDGLTLEGDGNISVTGIKSQSLTVALPGSGNIEATLTGDGSITLTATHRLTAKVSGSGTVLYGGNPADVAQSAGTARSALDKRAAQRCLRASRGRLPKRSRPPQMAWMSTPTPH